MRGLTEEPEVGKIYNGTVASIKDFGAFVTILPGIDGMLHISQIRHIIASFFVGLLYFVSVRYLLVTYTSLSNTACICISFFLSVFVLPNPVAIYARRKKQLDKEVPPGKTDKDDKNAEE